MVILMHECESYLGETIDEAMDRLIDELAWEAGDGVIAAGEVTIHQGVRVIDRVASDLTARLVNDAICDLGAPEPMPTCASLTDEQACILRSLLDELLTAQLDMPDYWITEDRGSPARAFEWDAAGAWRWLDNT